MFSRVSTSFWTPHSARAFLPSCTKALGVPKEERCYLGRWSARGSDTYTRVAARVISNLQRLVIRALIERPNADPLAEEETILQFESFMCEKGVGPEDRAKCFKQLGKDSVSIPVARTAELVVEEVWLLSSSEVILETEQLAETVQDRERISVSRAKATPRKSVIVPDVYWNQDTTYRLTSWETAT